MEKALKAEYGESTNSVRFHEMLVSRKIKKSERVEAYFLKTKEIANRGYVEDEPLIENVIDR